MRLTVSVMLCCSCGKTKRTKSSCARAQHSFSVDKVLRTTVAHAMRQKGCCNHPSKEQTFIVVNECKPIDAILLVMVSTQMIKLHLNSICKATNHKFAESHCLQMYDTDVFQNKKTNSSGLPDPPLTYLQPVSYQPIPNETIYGLFTCS